MAAAEYSLPPLPPPRPTRRLTPLQDRLLDDGARCWECPLGRGGAPGRPVQTQWDVRRGQPKLALVGEAPGKREVQRGAVFIGPSGKLLDAACRAGGVPRQELAILNAGACGPIPSGADEVKARVLAACRPRLISELQRLQPATILSIGGLALKTIAPKAPSGVTVLRGAFLNVGADVPTPTWRPSFVASFHPAHILRGGDAEAPDDAPGSDGNASVDLLYYFLVYDLAKAWRLAHGRVQPWHDDCDLFVTSNGRLHRAMVGDDGLPCIGDEAQPAEFVEAMARVRDDAEAEGAFSSDVETDAKDSLAANLTAISFATKGGGLAATWAAYLLVPGALAIAKALLGGRLSKWFQNRIYDCVVLPRHGLPVAHPIEDTMLLHHAAFPGLPHKLDQIAQQLLVVPSWKDEFRKSTKNPAELVLYNFRDSAATALIPEPLRTVVAQHRTARVYEADRQVVGVAQWMREFGFWVDRKEQARQSAVQHARLEYMQGSLEESFRAIAADWLDRLARNVAVGQRKHDSDDFMARVTLRRNELARRPASSTDIPTGIKFTVEKTRTRKGVTRVVSSRECEVYFKPKAKADLVALFEVLRIPFIAYTPKGAPVTDKKAMETAAAKHPLMRQLIHIREAQHVLATYIDGLPVKRDGRVHPDWSVTKISGRWSAGKSQNIPKQVAGWPPEVGADGKWKRKASGDYVTPIENARAIITAPTAAEILNHALDAPDVYEDARYKQIHERAMLGFGRKLVGADMNQLELRIAALLGKDPFLLNAYSTNADVHAMNAGVCFPKIFPKLADEFKTLAMATAYGAAKPLTLKADLSKLDKLNDIERARLLKVQKPWSKLRDLAKRLVYAWIYRGRAETAYSSLVKEFPEVELSAVAESFRLLDERIVGWVAWCNRNEVLVRQQREVREALLGRVRLFPLGNYNINIAVNFPVQAFGATLITKAFFRYCAVVFPELLEVEKLYAMDLLDREWVEARRAEGYDKWAAPAVPIINGHDAITAECDDEDAISTCAKCGRQGFGQSCVSCGAQLPQGRMSKFLELCMDFNITIDGASMHFFGEAAVGVRLSET